MIKYILSWLKRIRTGTRGFLIWFKVGYQFILPPGILLLTIWLLGYGWIELTIVFALGMILIIAEMFNYAIEKLCNLVEPNKSKEVKIIKDICAGTVAISGTVLVIVGLYIIF